MVVIHAQTIPQMTLTSDGDGVCDSEDICNGGDDNVDSDGDGVPDHCDICPDDAADDSDHDGVCYSDDNFVDVLTLCVQTLNVNTHNNNNA